jgi:hypothetical protein
MDTDTKVCSLMLLGITPKKIAVAIGRSATTIYKAVRKIRHRYSLYMDIVGDGHSMSVFIASESVLGKDFYIKAKNAINSSYDDGVMDGVERTKAKTVHFTMVDGDDGLKRVIAVSTGDGDDMFIDYPDEDFWDKVEVMYKSNEMPIQRKNRLLRAV